MAILNFIPLLVWSVGFLWITAWLDVRTGKDKQNGGDSDEVFIWLIGIVVWLVIGIVLTSEGL